MIKKHIPFLLFVIVAFTLSCSKGTSELQSEDLPSTPQGEETPLPPLPGAQDQSNSRHATLTQGKITALGLVIPDGMSPGPAPRKVYRFEGNYPVFQVATFIHKQVADAKIAIEDGGYLMQRARVRNPKGSASGKEILGIRVFKGQRKGATIDIWLEREYAQKLPAKEVKPRSRTRANMNRSERERRGRDSRETMRVMKKMTSGQPLDEKDRNSPFFD
jgi:hypothetical protein